MIVPYNHYTHSPSSKERNKKIRRVRSKMYEERPREFMKRKRT
jgi:hypothetical protein